MKFKNISSRVNATLAVAAITIILTVSAEAQTESTLYNFLGVVFEVTRRIPSAWAAPRGPKCCPKQN